MKADKGRKFRQGGALKETDAETNPGLAKLPTDVRNKMGYMKKGGDVKHSDVKMDKKVVKKAVKMHDDQLHGGKKTNLSKLKTGGRIASKGEHGVQKQSTRGAMMVKMKKGGACK